MRIFWALLALSVPVILLYAPFLNNPLVFDDARFFVSGKFSSYLHPIFIFNLRWLPYATFVWTRQLLGDGIVWLRLGNLLIHLITTATLFFFLHRLFELVIPVPENNKSLSPFWLAFFAALIFAVHPVSVYDTAYLVQRSTLMATLFALLTWRLFLEGLIRENRLWLTASALTYALAALSKEHAIMTPAVSVALLLLISAQPLQRIKLVWSTFVLYALIGAFVVFQVKAKNVLGQMYEPLYSEFILDIDAHLLYPLSILTQSFTFFKYLWVWLIPSPALMSIDTCQSFATHLWSLPEVVGLIGFLIYPYFAVRLLLQKGLKGLLGFALICPWLLFLTELSTVRIQDIFVLYRSYLWMVGLFAGLPFLCQKLTAKQSIITLTCIALLMMPLTWLRLTTFSHSLLLWDDAARRVKDDKSCASMDRIFNTRAIELAALGRYPEAIADFTRSLQMVNLQNLPETSGMFKNYYNRGLAYLDNQQFQLALNDFNVLKEYPIKKIGAPFYFYKAQAFEGLHELTSAREFYAKSCLGNMMEGCGKQKELEAAAVK